MVDDIFRLGTLLARTDQSLIMLSNGLERPFLYLHQSLKAKMKIGTKVSTHVNIISKVSTYVNIISNCLNIALDVAFLSDKLAIIMLVNLSNHPCHILETDAFTTATSICKHSMNTLNSELYHYSFPPIFFMSCFLYLVMLPSS